VIVNDLDDPQRQAVMADITYGTNNEYASIMRDNMSTDIAQCGSAASFRDCG